MATAILLSRASCHDFLLKMYNVELRMQYMKQSASEGCDRGAEACSTAVASPPVETRELLGVAPYAMMPQDESESSLAQEAV
jgi:hypothetical protein